ncbi:MAG: class I adenylate-forming enzyme family protein [Myxococcaceae bacterium]
MTHACPVQSAARNSPGAKALETAAVRWNYSELEAQIDATARRWGRLGVQPGDRIASLCGNEAQSAVGFFACARVGAVWAPVHARLAPVEQAALLKRLAPARLLDENGADGPWSPTDSEAPAMFSVPRAPPDGTAAILFSSGTTGTPKAVLLSWRNFDALADAARRRLGDSPADRFLLSLPLHHVGGLAMLYRAMWSRARVHLEARWDAQAHLSTLADFGATQVSWVPTQLKRLLGVLSPSTRLSLRVALVGGGPVPASLLARADAQGLPAVQTYGLTEATSQVCTELPADATGETAGPPLEGVEVRVRAADGNVCPPGEIGEIEIRGPSVSSGYWGEKPRGEAWFATGDLGALDARGRLHVAARRVDLIVSGGENIYPAEVESVLARHPAVADAVVVPVMDEEWGQLPVAMVQARPGARVEEALLRAFAREQLAAFKVPKRCLEVIEVPRHANGKLNRYAARAHVERALGVGFLTERT